MKLEAALKKVSSLNGVQATFVFDQSMAIRAREVPVTYSNDILKRIANQLYQLCSVSWQEGVITQDFRLAFGKYAIYLRTFAQTNYLVVFTDKSVELSDLRQPINLATLVLEKAMRGDDESGADPSMRIAEMAYLAEKSLRSGTELDASFAGSFRRHCSILLGQLGRDLVDNGIEECLLVLPLRNEREMKILVAYVTDRVPHPVKRQIIEEDSVDLIRSAIKNLGPH